MRVNRTDLFVAVLIAVAGNGCGDPALSGPPRKFSDYADTSAEITCQQIFSCCPSAAVQSLYPDLDACKQAVSAAATSAGVQATIDAAVAAGTASFDAVAADACVLTRRAQGCDDPSVRPDLDPCHLPNLVHGTVGLGGSCTGRLGLCGSGLFCASAGGTRCASADESCVCAAVAKAGEPCTNAPCETELVCLAGGVCGTPLPAGAACATPDVCASAVCAQPGGCDPVDTIRQVVCRDIQ